MLGGVQPDYYLELSLEKTSDRQIIAVTKLLRGLGPCAPTGPRTRNRPK